MIAQTIESRLENAAVKDDVIAARDRVVRSYIDALNRADVDAIVRLFSEDAVVSDPLGSQAITGLTAIRAFYAEGPFLHAIKASLDGEVCIAANAAAFAFTAISDSKKMRIIDVFEFDRRGKVSRMVAYWCKANVTLT